MATPPIWGRARGLILLTDTACRNAKPGERDRKIADSGGLYLLVRKSGVKVWNWKYRFAGKEKRLTIGRYPDVKLGEARRRRDEARSELEEGLDPSTEKRRRKTRSSVDTSFRSVARSWHAQKSKALAERYAGQIMDRLEADVFPLIGADRIDEITPPMTLAVVRRIEERGSHEMAHRVRMHMSDVFVWGIASGLCTQDPAAIIRKALAPTNPQLRPAATKLKTARAVIEKTERLTDIYWATRLASRLLALTAARPGVVRRAERGEFEGLDGASPVWRIPAAKMKLTRERKRDVTFEFVMPLSPEAVATVQAAMATSPSPKWLFPGVGDRRKPISDSTLSGHYLNAGLRGQHVPHGWRSSFSTIMNERAAIEDRERDRQIIDLMLAHVPEGVEAAYNRAAYMPRRRELACAWAAMLMDGFPPPDTLIP